MVTPDDGHTRRRHVPGCFREHEARRNAKRITTSSAICRTRGIAQVVVNGFGSHKRAGAKCCALRAGGTGNAKRIPTSSSIGRTRDAQAARSRARTGATTPPLGRTPNGERIRRT